tara:strand:+ start:689 stop:1105 length:417 start_codon:yes stop_codon:yes gene_type:complete
MTDKITLKKFIEIIIEDRQINKSELADRIGMSNVQLSRSINGSMTFATFEKIMKALDSPVVFLMDKITYHHTDCKMLYLFLKLNAKLTGGQMKHIAPGLYSLRSGKNISMKTLFKYYKHTEKDLCFEFKNQPFFIDVN